MPVLAVALASLGVGAYLAASALLPPPRAVDAAQVHPEEEASPPVRHPQRIKHTHVAWS
jgi:hypothetical protein